MLDIIRGDLKSKPVSSSRLSHYFEKHKNDYNGVLYIGYPIIGTYDGGFQVDALLVTKELGVIAFHVEEDVNNLIDYKIIQDENYTKMQSKLISYKELTKGRSLAFTINVVTYAPAWNEILNEDENFPCFTTDETLTTYLKSLSFNDTDQYFEKILSVIQSITTIRKTKIRDNIKKVDSRGAKLRNLEKSIANLDRMQSAAVIETSDNVQRIRGLAGSGKTIIIALKVAYLHAKNPDWDIAVTFNTRSLKGQFKKLIRLFSYEHLNEEPNWDKINIIHAWGSPKQDGIYFDICKEHDIEYYNFKESQMLTRVYGEQFDKVCDKALLEIKKYREKYDVILIDEAQDFSKSFLKLCYKIIKGKNKKLIYAYDELQSLNKKTMEMPSEIFGLDSTSSPLVTLHNAANKPKEDILLYKCYRNSLQTLVSAHALGFGIYNPNGLIQMFEHSQLWTDIGYKIENGSLTENENIILYRDNESSPDFLSNHSVVDDLISFKSLDSREEQANYIVESIQKNINDDELRLDDIMVIHSNPKTTQAEVALIRQKLYDIGINSNLAGVSTSQDVFFTEDAITFTSIYRAKGNEAAMVYFINAHECYSGLELARKRNILFTAMTRSKAWLRVCGFGVNMNLLTEEFNKVKENDFKLKFKYPTKEEREHMNIVNRDMSSEEKTNLKSNQESLSYIVDSLKKGRIKKEDLSKEAIAELKSLFD